MPKDGSSPESAMPLREVSQKIGAWVGRLGAIWVEGQVIELNQRRGWVYLTVRDALAEASMQITAPASVLDLAGPVPEGSTIVAWVKPSWFGKNGRLTLQANEIRPSGEGRLLAQLEQRKRMLQAEGLFATSRKKRLPFLPRTIGLITSPGSDAERDFRRHVALRWPAAVIEMVPVAVQGPKCAEEVMVALHSLDVRPDVDVIVITRGGGSMEDLLGFHDEGLVRAAAGCRTPIVSAIGHEADTPLLDLVADLRASTPTDAAKRVVPDVADLARDLERDLTALRRGVMATVANEQRELDALRNRPVLLNPALAVDPHRERIDALTAQLHRSVELMLRQEKQAVEHARARIEAMSPKNTLARGYAILIDDVGETVTSVKGLEPGQVVEAYLADGQLELSIEDIATKEPS